MNWEMTTRARLLSNFFHSGFLTTLGYVIPFFAIPIIVERIGLTNYGKVALAQSICLLFGSASDFGFNIKGIREMGRVRSEVDKTSLVSTILVIKTFVLIILSFLYLILIISHPALSEDLLLYSGSFVLVLHQSFQNNWYFQSLQKYRYLTITTFLSRSIYFLLIFFYITNESDYYLVNIFNGGTGLIGSLILLMIIAREIRFSFQVYKKQELKEFIRDAAKLFLSNTVNSVRSTGVILASLFLSGSALGIYGIIDKIVLLIRNMYTVIYNAYFPVLCQLISEDNLKLVRTHISRGNITMMAICLVAFYVINIIDQSVYLYIETEFGLTRIYLLLILPIVVVVGMNFNNTLLMLGFGYSRGYLAVSILNQLSFVILFVLLGLVWGIQGFILGIICSELLTFMYSLGFRSDLRYGYRRIFN